MMDYPQNGMVQISSGIQSCQDCTYFCFSQFRPAQHPDFDNILMLNGPKSIIDLTQQFHVDVKQKGNDSQVWMSLCRSTPNETSHYQSFKVDQDRKLPTLHVCVTYMRVVWEVYSLLPILRPFVPFIWLLPWYWLFLLHSGPFPLPFMATGKREKLLQNKYLRFFPSLSF